MRSIGIMGDQKKLIKLFTTGQIADLMGLDVRTVAKWIDSGALVGVYLPPSNKQRERRVHRDELVKFCEANHYTWVLKELAAEEAAGAAPPRKGRRSEGHRSS
jgi:hypothetical protein